MKRVRWLWFLVVVGGFCFLGMGVKPVRAAGAVLVLDPATGSHKVGTSWTVKLNIDTGGEKVGVVDAKLAFDAEFLEVVSVQAGDFFDDSAQSINNTAGTLFWGGFFDSSLQTSTARTGTLATITLSAKGAGTAELGFDCKAGETGSDSSIMNAASEDVIDCTTLVNGIYTLTGTGGSPTPTVKGGTPTPTRSGGTPTPTPEQPDSGVWEPTVVGVGAGVLLLLLGIVMVF